MKRLFFVFTVLLYAMFIHAQGRLPDAISNDLPPGYKYTESRVLSSANENAKEGIVTFSLPQKNRCFGGDSAYITVSYTYYSKLSAPKASEIVKKKEAFANGAKENHKEVVKNIPLGLLNFHDKEYIDFSQLSFVNQGEVDYFHYFTSYKCRGFANGVTNELLEQKFIEYQFAIPDSVTQQLFRDYQYSDIYMTARADKELKEKDVTIILHGTFTHEVAYYHTKQMMDFFLSFDFGKLSVSE